MKCPKCGRSNVRVKLGFWNCPDCRACGQKTGWIVTTFAVLLGGLLAVSTADAGGCRVVAVQPAIVQKVVVQEKVVIKEAVVVAPVATFVPLVVQVPTYSAGYVPAPAMPAADQGIAEELRQLRAEVRALKGGTRREPSPMGRVDEEPAARTTASDLLAQNCAKCHSATSAKASGGGLVLVGKQLEAETLGAIIDEVSSGRMPKSGKMTAESRLALIASLVNDPAKK